MSLSSTADGLPRVAILGGGQLGQMLTLEAIELGLEVTIFERTADSPAARIASHEVVGTWDDRAAQAELLSHADVVTLENEFVDAEVLQTLRASGAEVFPSPETLARIQDKLVQKQTLAAAQLPVPRFARVDAPRDLPALGRELGWPLVLKARRGGYDGKGNALVERGDDAEVAFRALGWPASSLMVEKHVQFRSELAVMVVRGRDGLTLSYPVVDTVQRDHICHSVVAPARVSATARDAATNVACAAVEAFDGVGIFGVELFLLHGDGVLVNELAPRPHNSGHYTIEACETSQFENHLRAVLGWPLGSPRLIYPGAAMVNLLGKGVDAVTGLRAALAVPGAHAHLYGKRPSVKGRKMGHVTALGDSGEDALRRAQAAADVLEV
jgi:5-(carboxyamino)imidazole ribonucleotide synthase